MISVAIISAWEFRLFALTVPPAGSWTSSSHFAYPMVGRVLRTRTSPALCMHPPLPLPVLSIIIPRLSISWIVFVHHSFLFLYILYWSELMLIHGFFFPTFPCNCYTDAPFVVHLAIVPLLQIYLRVPLLFQLYRCRRPLQGLPLIRAEGSFRGVYLWSVGTRRRFLLLTL
jgi:hypothetical protein